ncbi:hypothetical protein BJV78DRAFT_1273361 [Lactifluus subvellereus]|nr:hypothetical protein BJV78DRAFT_1273361 [Lactifluus subvellereus]
MSQVARRNIYGSAIAKLPSCTWLTQTYYSPVVAGGTTMRTCLPPWGRAVRVTSYSSHTLPSPPSELEARYYYASLPSRPVLVARTGTTLWEARTGPEAFLMAKELRTVGNHALKEVWEDNLALRLHAILDSRRVSAPVNLWIGVIPASLSGDDGIVVASRCRELLEEYNIADVDVEIRESVVTRSSGPTLLTPADSFDATVDVCEPLTTTLGLLICAQSTPWAEGTGGFFITEGGNTERLLLVTARHVVFTPNKCENRLFEHKNASQRRHNVTLFGAVAFNKYLESIQAEIGAKAIIANLCERRIKAIEGKDDAAAVRARQKLEAELNEANEAIGALDSLYQDVSTRWATPKSRVLGHVILYPHINVGIGSEGYTEDWAVIEIDASKVDPSNFGGNAVDLGTRIPPDQLTLKMYPNPQNPHSFTYPADRLLRLKGTIPDNELRNPTALDQNGDPCLPVITRSGISGLTIGRANNVLSYTRNYCGGDSADTSKQWSIFSYDSKSGAFSTKGDSGSVIADGLGRIGGLLTGGAGTTASSDITYATPINFVLKRMQENGIHKPNVSPVLTA